MPTILVIDDDGDLCDMLVAGLENAGYQVLACVDGVHGLRIYRQEQPDLVLTDIIMPGADGLEVIREIKHINPRARILAMSGSYVIQKEYCLRIAAQLGAMAVLPKPFTLDELRAMVRNCLAGEAPPFPPESYI